MSDEVDFERAEALAQAERDAGARRARASVSGAGSAVCQDCGEEIEPARRAAAPWAVRCIACQQASERRVA